MYYVKFNKETSKAYRDSMFRNVCFLRQTEAFLTQHLKCDGSITLRYILDALGVYEECPKQTFAKTSKDCYIDLGLGDILKDFNMYKDTCKEIVLCIEVYT